MRHLQEIYEEFDALLEASEDTILEWLFGLGEEDLAALVETAHFRVARAESPQLGRAREEVVMAFMDGFAFSRYVGLAAVSPVRPEGVLALH
ncbi:MAG: hypothetical protein ACYCX3_11605 [Thermoleophilia bacterium]